MTDRARWALVAGILAACLGLVIWLTVTDAPVVRFVVRLYRDKYFLRDTVASWGWMAPLVFIFIQALQVVISPIPGEITGPVGGAIFGTTWGVIYSTIGLTIGTIICFWVGRKWGEPLVRPWLSEHHWDRLNFILEAEGAILCFILYLIPGFPKDIISYLFGIITGVIFFVLEKDNQFVRFHAMQSILVNATFIVLAIILSIFSVIPILGWIVGLLGNMILGIVAIILWLVLMFKAFQGQEWEVPIIGKYARQYSSSATI